MFVNGSDVALELVVETEIGVPPATGVAVAV
jgi:hypothetical protein